MSERIHRYTVGKYDSDPNGQRGYPVQSYRPGDAGKPIAWFVLEYQAHMFADLMNTFPQLGNACDTCATFRKQPDADVADALRERYK